MAHPYIWVLINQVDATTSPCRSNCWTNTWMRIIGITISHCCHGFGVSLVHFPMPFHFMSFSIESNTHFHIYLEPIHSTSTMHSSMDVVVVYILHTNSTMPLNSHFLVHPLLTGFVVWVLIHPWNAMCNVFVYSKQRVVYSTLFANFRHNFSISSIQVLQKQCISIEDEPSFGVVALRTPYKLWSEN